MSVKDHKLAAARRALGFVEPKMRLGLGTGSTASLFVELLAAEVQSGLSVLCVPTSEETRALAAKLGVPLTTLDETPLLDLTIDGADEVDGELRLIKGGGGALLREKIVASASDRMVVIADAAKVVDGLGRFPLPVEIVPFAYQVTMERIADAAARCGCGQNLMRLRGGEGHAFRTDSGNYIADCAAESIPDPERLARLLGEIPGVVDHGLFISMASLALVGSPNGVRILELAHH